MMKRILFVALILVGIIIASGCSTQSPVGTANNTTININNVSVPSAPVTPSASANRIPQTYTVNIQNYTFNPPSLQINAGDTVKWVNMDSVPHEPKGTDFDSGSLAPNSTFIHTFNNTGTYNYICAIDPSMKGNYNGGIVV
jgi:plastocyanin